MNKELFKDSRLDFFILWANGYIHEEEILSEINKNFKIIRIKRHKPFIFFYDVLKIYKYSFIPIYFLFKKLFYLKNYQKEFTAIEVINDKPNLVHNFNGIFRSYHCTRIQNLKENIRYNFGHPKSEEHVVHSTDSFHDYLAIKNLIGEKNRIVSDYLEESFINIEDLYCIQSFGNRHNYKESSFTKLIRRDGRVVECTGLENRQRRKSFVSSNLTLSAINIKKQKGKI